MPRCKFIFAPLGSAGDVHPHIWLAKLLRDRGHEVVMVCQSVVAEIPERAGIRATTWGNKDEQEALLQNPDIWHPTKGFELLMSCLPQWTREMRPVLLQEIQNAQHPPILIGGTLALATKLASEQTNTPLIDLHLQPSMFVSVEDLPVMRAGMEFLPNMPRWLRKAFVAIMTWQVNRILGPLVRQAREDAGIPAPHPRKDLMTYTWHPKDGELALFPDWYARKAPDWPPQSVVTRFPLYDESTDRPLDPELEAFFVAGTPPVIITPGSANAHAADFIRESVAACKIIGRRALVITRFPEQAGTMPAGSACFKYVPFGRAFPRGAAVIHHGGIGTMAQCMAAAVPQLIMPMSHDQPDNASRIKKFGIGDYLYPKKFKAQRIAEKLAALIDNPTVKSACAEYQNKIRNQMPPEHIAEIIESMADRALEKSAKSPALSGT